MNESPEESSLEELFLAYWDNTLTDAQAAELNRRLAIDAEARDAFEAFCLHAVVAADLLVDYATAPAGPGSPTPGRRRWSRRRMLGLLGGGLAAGFAGVAGAAITRLFWADPPRPSVPGYNVRLVGVQGNVTVETANGRSIAAPGPIQPGSTVSTHGPSASAMLFYPNGTGVTLGGDSDVTVHDEGHRLDLHRGVATAEVRERLPGRPALTLATPAVLMADLSEVLLTLDHAASTTEVGVERGSVSVAAPGGRPLGEVRGGELLTVQADGDHEKQPIPTTPDSFAWNLTRPLPNGWAVGTKAAADDRPVVLPAIYPDPYYGGEKMFQIRSNKQWTRGFFRLESDSQIRVRYRVTHKGSGQVCFCVRTTDIQSSETGMLEWNGEFVPAAPGQWQELPVRAEDMKLPPNKHVPRFGPPWVGFLVIFNTYQKDLGLMVSDFRVTPPGAG
ncbi:MAG TPA: hypothetical protein VKE74_10430 [Gemmataceae bacterium]|nr:hypothetical protein [Gemmataceae bacterium]